MDKWPLRLIPQNKNKNTISNIKWNMLREDMDFIYFPTKSL